MADTTITGAHGGALLDGPSDAELIAAVRGGDVDAYGVLFERHVDSARRLARSLSRDGEADDLVSEAFAKVLTVLQRGEGPDTALRPYLLTALRRLHVDRVRAITRARPTEDMSVYDSGEAFHDTAVAGFESGAAARAFASLPERWQLVLWHLEVEGQKPADIAPLLGISANSVSALAYRAREGLRQAFVSMHASDTDVERCQTVRAQLGAFIRQDISKRDSAHVETHLRDCRECAGIYLELVEVNSDLRAILAPLLLGGAAAAYVASAPAAAAAAGGLLGLWHAVGNAFGTGSAGGASGGAAVGTGAATGGTAVAGTATSVGAVTAGAGAAGAGAATAGAAAGAAAATSAATGALTAGAATAGAATAGAATAGAAAGAAATSAGLISTIVATPIGMAAASVAVTAVAATTVVAGVQVVTDSEPTAPPSTTSSAEAGSDPSTAPSGDPSTEPGASGSQKPEDGESVEAEDPADKASSDADGADTPSDTPSDGTDGGTDPGTDPGPGGPSGDPEPTEEPRPSEPPAPTGNDVAITSTAASTSGVAWVVKLDMAGLDPDQAGVVTVTLDRPAIGFHLDPRCDLISFGKLTCRITGPGRIKLLVTPKPGAPTTLTGVLEPAGDPDPNLADNTTRVLLG